MHHLIASEASRDLFAGDGASGAVEGDFLVAALGGCLEVLPAVNHEAIVVQVLHLGDCGQEHAGLVVVLLEEASRYIQEGVLVAVLEDSRWVLGV